MFFNEISMIKDSLHALLHRWRVSCWRVGIPVKVPVGFASFPGEVVPPIRSWVEPVYENLVHWADYDKGGHFAAFEVPDTFVAELRTYFRQFR